MEFVKFNIGLHKKSRFMNAFDNILNESDISCNQIEFKYEANLIIAEIPKSVIDKMNEDQISILNSFG